ncbi:MAG: ATP-binding protein [Desulfurivibrio sp.]|nr:ATP-binding protein [Desulfurivibrio sp.]
MADDELLRETLIDLARAREHEERQRRNLESLLAGLQVLIKPMESSRMFKELLQVMQGVLEFSSAFVLTHRPDGSLAATVTTDDIFSHCHWHPEAMLERVLAGKPVTIFDVNEVTEWRTQPAAVLEQVGSALHIPLRNGEQVAILVCTHPRRNFFSRGQQRLAENFSALASQALLNAERQQMETQLFQARKMEALGILAGGIAHDFNNILTPIVINTQMAQLEAGDKKHLQQSLQQIEQAAQRAGGLIQQIQDFNRQGKHDPRPIQLGSAIKEGIKFLRSTLAPNIEMEYKQIVGHDLVAADPTQIIQVVMNLALNAAHAMQESGGRLEIILENAEKAPPVPPPDTPTGDWLKLVVSDTGPGIAPEHLNRIFDPFFTTKGKGEGSGMGLAVVHGIISRHGGTITVYSEPGQGACFEILLPAIAETTEPAATMDATAPAYGNRERILFVDDELPVIEAFTPMLERLGYRVDTTTSGRAALDILRRHPASYDLLVTDYHMPDLNGDELALAALEINPQLPVVLCTGFSGSLSEQDCRQMGITAYVAKPFRVDQFAATIQRALRQAREDNDKD